MAKVYDPIMCMMVDKPDKAQDEILFYQLRFSSGRTEGAKLDESEIRSYAEALLEKYGEKQVAVSRQGKIVATYLNRKAYDSASALDKAIKTTDGMFQQIFGKYSSAAKQHYDRAVKELIDTGYLIRYKDTNFYYCVVDNDLNGMDADDYFKWCDDTYRKS